MGEMDEVFDALEKRKGYLSEWLERHAEAHRIAPNVQQNLEITEWEIEALTEMPEEATEIPFPTPTDVYYRRNQLLSESLPMLPDYRIAAITSATASTSGSSGSTYGFVARVGDLDVPRAQEYSQKYTMQYWQIQENQSRPNHVRNQLQRLGNPQTIQRFDRALRAFHATKTGTGECTVAAAEMRTLLDGIKGDLWERARLSQKENMTWVRMADRLAKGEDEKKELISQIDERNRLYSRLSDIFKNREGGSLTNLNHVWTQLLEHVYAVLNLVHL